ncbi:MAG TPA: glucose 1-dehydrogenase [Chloroflexota bacterium]|nr:glucose 1-dehydrogenase [Chloroflexota bacterium]
MKAIAVVPGTTDVRLVERPEPGIRAADQVKLRVLEVGICGTDREEANGHRADLPPGLSDLVLGHEMLGRVVEVGSGVSSVQPGDYALFTVRRGCGHCEPCAQNRSDMCASGDYTERGIRAADGFQTEVVVDTEQYLVKVPLEMRDYAVLTEPMSVAAKAIDEAAAIQAARLPGARTPEEWLRGKRALVAGLGPIGLLAAFALTLRGVEVIGLDVADEDAKRPSLLKRIGGRYVDGRKVRTDALDDHLGQVDLIFEATGVAALEFELIDALGINGIYVLTGIPGGDRPIDLDGAALIRQLVLNNQVIVGSVNANREHFVTAVRDLERAEERWKGAVRSVITHRVPVGEFGSVIYKRLPDEIKSVITWG